MDIPGKSLSIEAGIDGTELFTGDAANCEQDLQEDERPQIVIRVVKSEPDLREFVELPHKIYQNDPFWPGQDDEYEMSQHSPKTYYPLTFLQTQLFLAERDGEIAGRISASINERHNQTWNQNIGFFGHFECLPDQDVAQALLKAAEDWVRAQGKDEIYGPFSYMYYDIIGFVVQGGHARPTIGLAYNPDYYPAMVENCGYGKIRDVLEVLAPVEEHYKILQQKRPEVAHLDQDSRFSIRKIDKEHVREELLKIREIYLDSFTSLWSIRALEEEEWLATMEASLPTLPDELFLIAEDQGEPIAFLFHVDDYNQKLHYQRHGLEGEITRIKAYAIGIRREYQKLGIGKWISIEAVERMRQMKYEEVSFSWIDAENKKSIGLSTSMGGQIDKVYRIFSRKL